MFLRPRGWVLAAVIVLRFSAIDGTHAIAVLGSGAAMIREFSMPSPRQEPAKFPSISMEPSD